MSILLVEDNPADTELTLRAFSRRKLTSPVAVARDGEEALDYVHRRGAFAAGAPVPGVILLDLRLPKVDGMEVLARSIERADGFDQRPVGVVLSVLASMIRSHKHRVGSLDPTMTHATAPPQETRSTLHRQFMTGILQSSAFRHSLEPQLLTRTGPVRKLG